MEVVFGGNIYNLEDTHEFGVFLNKYMNANGMSITPIERKKEKDKDRGTTLTVGGDNGPPTLTIGGAPDDSTPSPVTPAPPSPSAPMPPPTTPSVEETIDLSIATGSGVDTEYGTNAKQKTKTIERLLREQDVTPEQLYTMLFGVRAEGREQERVTLDQNTYRVDGASLEEYLETNPGTADELITGLAKPKEKGPELAQKKIDAIHRTRGQLGLSDEEFVAVIRKFIRTEKDCVEKVGDKFVIDSSKLEEENFLRDRYNHARVDLDKLLADAAREGGITELNRLENEIREFAKTKENQIPADDKPTLAARVLANLIGVLEQAEDILYKRREENQIAKLIENIDALPTGDAARILADNNVKSIRAEQKEEKPLEIVIEFTDGEESRSSYKDKKGKYNKAAANSGKQAKEQVVISNLQQLDAALQDRAGQRNINNPDGQVQTQQENRGESQPQPERTSRRSLRGDRSSRRSRSSERVEQAVIQTQAAVATIQASVSDRQNPVTRGDTDTSQRPEQQEQRLSRSGRRSRSGEPRADKQRPDRIDDVAKGLNLKLDDVRVAGESSNSLKPPKVDNLPSREELRQR